MKFTHSIRGRAEKVTNLLVNINKNLDGYFEEMPPSHDHVLTSVGYSGFRAVTQVDPLWNAYLLGLVISVGSDIEAARLDVSEDIVHSYRFNDDMNEKGLFDPKYGWGSFHEKANELSGEFEYVIITDVSDFYPRIYHHRLENALKKCTKNSDAVSKILMLLKNISVGNVSYGLPVGGPAARLLSELVLNSVDRLLKIKGIKFCRFVDDYRIFASSKEEAFASLVFLGQKLLDNDGLLLQKNKTRLMTASEYLSTNVLPEEMDEDEEKEVKSFLAVNIHFDPYSETAKEDYEELKEEIKKFDIVGMLSKEIRKTRIHESLTKQLLRAIKHIKPSKRDMAIETLCDNINLLSPVFPTVVILMLSLLNDMSESTKERCFLMAKDLIDSDSHITQVPVNLGYAVRLLSHDKSDESDAVLQKSYDNTNSLSVKRDVIVAMAKHDSSFWISDRRRQYSTLTTWEKRALLIASYMLEDEGREWRKTIKNSYSDFEKIVVSWASELKNSGTLQEAL